MGVANNKQWRPKPKALRFTVEVFGQRYLEWRHVTRYRLILAATGHGNLTWGEQIGEIGQQGVKSVSVVCKILQI